MLIGLTGLYCAGKNHVGLLLEKHGLAVLDVDKLGHKAIQSQIKAITARFGIKVLDAQGQVNRRILAQLVFGNKAALADLEAIIHPVVDKMAEEWIARQKGDCVINAALLHRSSLYKKLDTLIVVKAPFICRLFRSIKRDKLGFFESFKRILSQADFPKYFLTYADIYNVSNSCFSGNQKNPEKQIQVILEGIRYGKEKTITGSGFGGGVSGNCG